LYGSDSIEKKTSVYILKTKDLENKLKDYKVKKKEYEKFPEYIKELNEYITESTKQMNNIMKEKPWAKNITFKPLINKLNDLKEFAENKTKERNQKPATSDPLLTQYIISSKKSPIRALIRELKKLKKPVIKKEIIGTCPNKALLDFKNEINKCPIDSNKIEIKNEL